jgi:protoporphyrinogen oxidase
MFFENYTQKVWGLHPKDISKEWGEQRIKGLSLSKAIINALLSPFKLLSNKQKETSLIDEFFYPKYGCGQLWDAMAEDIKNMGGEIHLNSKVVGFNTSDSKISSVTIIENSSEKTVEADYIISSMPIKDLVSGLGTAVPEKVQSIAKNLPYRDYILLGFYCNKINLKNNTKIPTINNICPDNWIYIQEDDVTAGRMQIMNNWSPYLVKDFENKVFLSL